MFFFLFSFFFFNDTATTEIYTLSLHDALPIWSMDTPLLPPFPRANGDRRPGGHQPGTAPGFQRLRSEEHTSELQSHSDLVCRLLLEKKKKKKTEQYTYNTEKKNKKDLTHQIRV